MFSYTPWTWSLQYQRHFMYKLGADGTILETLWAGPPTSSEAGSGQQAVVSVPSTSTVDPSIPRHATAQTSYPLQGQMSLPENSPPRQYATTNNAQSAYYNQSAATNGYQASYSGSNTIPNASARSGYATTSYSNAPIQGSSSGYVNQSSYQSSTAAQSSRSPYSSYAPPSLAPALASNIGQQPAGHSSAYQQGVPAATQNVSGRSNIAALPEDVQTSLGHRTQRFIRTGVDENNTETLDPRYRRVSGRSHAQFFVPGRVFKMLWIEPAGLINPGKTRGTTHFSYTVKYGEEAFCEIRRFVVVRNRGTFSQCIPIQTYRGQGATKPGLIVHDHGVIYTCETPPPLLHGERIDKYSIRVEPTGTETLEAASRVNYGKPYAVEHNVKVLDVGMVAEAHRYLIPAYFDSAMRGP